jgi:hypothetical protein
MKMKRSTHMLRDGFCMAFIVVLIINQMVLPGAAKADVSATTTPQKTPVVQPDKLQYGGNWDTQLPTPDRPVPNFANLIASQAKAPAPDIRLKVSVDPAIYIPGQPVQLTWQMKGYGSQTGSASVIFTLPQGITPGDAGLAGQVSADGKLQLTVSNSTQNTLMLNVGALAQFPLYIGADLSVGGQTIDRRPVYLDQGGVGVQKITGNTAKISAFGGKAKVEMPAAALTEDLVLEARNPSPNTTPPTSLSGAPVEIVAVGKTSKRNVKTFSTPITIQIPYDTSKLFGGSEDDLMVFYYDEDNQGWYPMPTQVDKANQLLTVQSDHLTVFDYQAASWQKYSLPTVDSFKVSGFTGAGTYDLGFWAPDGPGGFKPGLQLTYNSQVIDESSAFSQASWVGMGWSLDTGSITRNMHATNTDLTDDTFSISVNGISGMLLPIKVDKDANGTVVDIIYNTADQSFNRVEYYATDAWKVWGKDGTIYDFAKTSKTAKSSGCATSDAGLDVTWRWSLSTTTDTNNNAITYAYTDETKSTCLNKLAVYPDTITYPNNRYRIHFILSTRTDYQTAWASTSAKALYSAHKLDSIQIEQSLDGTWGSPIVLRKYQFTYTSGGSNQIYPNYTWSKGGYTLTLAGVQEFSGDGNTSLSPVSFSYADGMHLTTVDNGQGGQVSMAYTPWTYFDNTKDKQYVYNEEFGVSGKCANGLAEWYFGGGYSSYLRCDPNTNPEAMQVGQYNTSGSDPEYLDVIAFHTFPESAIKLGGKYRFNINADAIDYPLYSAALYWGMDDGTNFVHDYVRIASANT